MRIGIARDICDRRHFVPQESAPAQAGGVERLAVIGDLDERRIGLAAHADFLVARGFTAARASNSSGVMRLCRVTK